VAFETRIAQVSWTRAERRDDDKTYNPMSIAELQAAAPGFPWKAYLAGADLGAVQRVIVSENTAIPKIAAIYAATPLPTLQAWSAFHFVDAAAPYLPKRFVDAQFEFRSKELQGQPEQRARWKRAVDHVRRRDGRGHGRSTSSATSRPDRSEDGRAGRRPDNRDGQRLSAELMSPATKQKALAKLAKFNVKIGYPEVARLLGATGRRGDAIGTRSARGPSSGAYKGQPPEPAVE
jgi:putative endopeptidase